MGDTAPTIPRSGRILGGGQDRIAMGDTAPTTPRPAPATCRSSASRSRTGTRSTRTRGLAVVRTACASRRSFTLGCRPALDRRNTRHLLRLGFAHRVRFDILDAFGRRVAPKAWVRTIPGHVAIAPAFPTAPVLHLPNLRNRRVVVRVRRRTRDVAFTCSVVGVPLDHMHVTCREPRSIIKMERIFSWSHRNGSSKALVGAALVRVNRQLLCLGANPPRLAVGEPGVRVFVERGGDDKC